MSLRGTGLAIGATVRTLMLITSPFKSTEVQPFCDWSVDSADCSCAMLITRYLSFHGSRRIPWKLLVLTIDEDPFIISQGFRIEIHVPSNQLEKLGIALYLREILQRSSDFRVAVEAEDRPHRHLSPWLSSTAYFSRTEVGRSGAPSETGWV